MTFVVSLHGAGVSTAISTSMAAGMVSICPVALRCEWAGPRSGARQRSPYIDWPAVNRQSKDGRPGV